MGRRNRSSRSGRPQDSNQRHDSSQILQNSNRDDSCKTLNTHFNHLPQRQRTEIQREKKQLNHGGGETASSPTVSTSRVQFSNLPANHQLSKEHTESHQKRSHSDDNQIQGPESSPFIPDFVSTPTRPMKNKFKKKQNQISGSDVASISNMEGNTKDISKPVPIPVPIDPRLTDSFVKLQQNVARQKARQSVNSQDHIFVSRASVSDDDKDKELSSSSEDDDSSSDSTSSSSATDSSTSESHNNSAILSTESTNIAATKHKKKHEKQKKNHNNDTRESKDKDGLRKKKPHRKESDVEADHTIQERHKKNAKPRDETNNISSATKNKPVIPLYTSRNQRPTSTPTTQTEQEITLSSARDLESSLLTSLKSVIPVHTLSHATTTVKKSLNKTAKRKHNKLPFPDINDENQDDNHGHKDDDHEATGPHTDAATLKAAYTLILQLSGHRLNPSSSNPTSTSTTAILAASQSMQSDLARIATERMTRIAQLETEVHGLKSALKLEIEADEKPTTEDEDEDGGKRKKRKRSRKA